MPEMASENEQLWQLGEAWVFDQMTSNQASGGLKHEYYHHFHSEQNRFQMTRPNGEMDLIWNSMNELLEVQWKSSRSWS